MACDQSIAITSEHLGDFYCSMSLFRFCTHFIFHCMTAFLPLLICLDLLITVVVSSWPTQISGVYEKGNVIGTGGFSLLKVLFSSEWRVRLSWASLISLWMAKSQKNTMQPIKLAMNSSYFSVCLQLLYWNHFYYLPFVSLNLNLMQFKFNSLWEWILLNYFNQKIKIC